MTLTKRALWLVGTGAVFLLALTADARANEPNQAEVTVGGFIDVNGQTEIPRGLFGVHAFRLTEQAVEEYGIECIRQIHYSPNPSCTAIGRDGKVKDLYKKLSVVIDCPGDRYAPPSVLKTKDYEEKFRRIGQAYARKCKDANWPGYAEFWNEPYLNWASRSHGSGRNVYHPKWYETEGRTAGGKVTIKGWDKPLEHLRWRKHWAKGEDGKLYYGVEIPEGLKPGDTFRGHSPKSWYFTNRKEQTFTVVEQWGIWDPTQVGFWSGRQNRDFYLWMFLPYAKAIKETNPKVQVLGGWDFGFSHGDWKAFTELYVPVIDQAHKYMDGVTEHHYGINSRWVPVWYEVACAYSVSKYDKWLKGYNTETAGHLDPAVHGTGGGEKRTGLSKEWGTATYLLRDVLELIYHSPAKSGSRTSHHVGHGEKTALKFLKNLRGRLIRTASDDRDVWTVASLNEETGELVVVVFNNAKDARHVKLTVCAPEGTRLKNARVGELGNDPDSGRLAIREKDWEIAGGNAATLAGTIGGRQAKKFVFSLTGKARKNAGWKRKQFFAKEGPLVNVKPGMNRRFTITMPPAFAAGAEKAVLRLVLEGAIEEAKPMLNGQEVKIDARPFVMDLPVDPANLKATNVLELSSKAEEGKGFRVVTASLIVDQQQNWRPPRQASRCGREADRTYSRCVCWRYSLGLSPVSFWKTALNRLAERNPLAAATSLTVMSVRERYCLPSSIRTRWISSRGVWPVIFLKRFSSDRRDTWAASMTSLTLMG
jgi:hypothetical protein